MREGAVRQETKANSRSAFNSGRWPRIAACALLLGLGVALGRVTAPDASLPAADPQPAEVGSAPQVPRVGGAVESRQGELIPAPTDHLVVVAISATTCGERAFGTGLVVSPDTIVTAAHVVGDSGLVRIDLGTQTYTGEVEGVMADGRDLAVITLPTSLPQPLSVAASVGFGDAVTIVGYPTGGLITSAVGTAVSVPEVAARVFRGPLIAVGVATQPGMSGGPAVDSDGNLVGILIASQPATQTAIVASIPDVERLLAEPLLDGRCPSVA